LFAPCHRIFDQFGFRQRERAWLLCRIYPFEGFLSDYGKLIVDDTKSSTPARQTHQETAQLAPV
jgi:hypothetical protein